jgi:hypothetical protein
MSLDYIQFLKAILAPSIDFGLLNRSPFGASMYRANSHVAQSPTFAAPRRVWLIAGDMTPHEPRAFQLLTQGGHRDGRA